MNRTEEAVQGSLLADIPEDLSAEVFDTLCGRDGVKVERIVSRGQCSPEGFWYDQDTSEFVLVVQGSAGLRLENRERPVVLRAGDYLVIDAHVKHRVEWTAADCDTIWLAVHY